MCASNWWMLVSQSGFQFNNQHSLKLLASLGLQYVFVAQIQLQNHHRPGHFLVKKSPNADYSDYPVPDYECRMKEDMDIMDQGCHPPCDPDRTFCEIYDYEVVMKPSSNQTQGRDGPMGRKEGETLRN